MPDLTWVPPRIRPSSEDDAAEVREVERIIAQGPFSDTWESLEAYEPPTWYIDAKFGIFVHWGAASVPATMSEWYPRLMYRRGSEEHLLHREHHGSLAEHGYKDFLPRFTMADYDAPQMAALFRQAGARFVVPVAEHHDGFTMYDEPRTRWRAPLVGPRRDAFGELAQATRELGMIAGASSHRAENWWFFNGGRVGETDVQEPEWSDLYGPAAREEVSPDEDFLQDWLLRTVHIIDRYRPQMLWFDFYIEAPGFEPYLRKVAAYYYNRAAEWGRGVVLFYKNEAFRPGTAVFDVERGASAGIRPEIWQNETAVSRNAWGHIDTHDYKTQREIVSELVDVISKNGCLLLNVGPKADGTLPSEEAELLRGVGRWLDVNGEGVYGTRPWRVFGEGPTASRAGAMIDAAPFELAHGDFRFTWRTNADVDYLYVLAVTAESRDVVVRSLASELNLLEGEVESVVLLGDLEPLVWRRDGDALRVHLPDSVDLQDGFGLRVAVQRPPRIERRDFLHNGTAP
ncbi:alpha-L-fucosidase [Microbacterium sp. H1-D42]|uniref:alpha-L-fucosidase n=1 Tax=Microbacterium sp. H1-D42 TaxID=2925844 RepID=UPI001F5317EF|nr:alpha-L-fucosidase [Microbacterium sp. H1-D42]UNK71388.1 alpha-L-fucosidase [Microbacterium sp. H1-D42]